MITSGVAGMRKLLIPVQRMAPPSGPWMLPSTCGGGCPGAASPNRLTSASRAGR